MHCNDDVLNEYYDFINNKAFPCVAAKDAVAKENIRVFVADHMACPKYDKAILNFIYDFTQYYRNSGNGFYSAAVIFKEPGIINEELFDALLWKRLTALKQMDELQYVHDKRVAANPEDNKYSFSLMEEAYFIIGLNPASSRPARSFKYPTLVFNPHAQFEYLKRDARYGKMQTIVRKRDVALAGSINPMLTDFGEASEVYQYSGKSYDKQWQCPLSINQE